MARSYANIVTAIWRDREFRTLPAAAQRTYLMLVTQPDISPCGILAMTLKRWSQNAADTPIESLSNDIAMLCAKRFLVVDDDTEEVLIRTFVKWDGGYKVPNRIKAILKSAAAIQSPALAQVVASELDKLGIDANPSGMASESLSEPIDDAISNPSTNPFESMRVVVTREVSSYQPTTHNPQPGEGKPSASDGVPPPEHCPKHPDGTDAPCRACRRARESREAWDVDRRRTAEAWRDWSLAQPECPHGIPGGDLDRPTTRTPACPSCRREKRAAS